MNKSILVADAGPHIIFGQLIFFQTIKQLLGTIIVPETVAQECIQDSLRPGALAIHHAVKEKIIQVYPNPDVSELIVLGSTLDRDETAAIALAIKLGSRLLIDEKLGRKAALKLNIKIIGTAGILLLAKREEMIPEVSPLIQQMKHLGYHLSDSLTKEVMKLADEEV